MTTATQPAPAPCEGRRGRSGYLQGCRCDTCAQAHYRYMARWRLDNARGQRRRTPSAPARLHVQQLLAAGWIQQQIADSAGINHHIVSDLVVGTYQTISRRTEAAILGVPVGPPPRPRDVDATGTIRRVRALIAIGWPLAQLAPHLGLHRDALGVISRGERERVRAETADQIADAYRRLAARPGPSVRSRRQAAAAGWPDPLWWEDYGGIDDPGTPETAEDAPAQPRWVDLAEDALWLENQGYTRRQAALRLGVTKDYIDQAIRRLGQRQQTEEAA